MPPHIKQRKDRGSTWYLIDGDRTESLRTTKKGIAQYLLEQYIKGKYGMQPTPTVKEFYDRWIETKVEPLFRRALIRDYKQTFNCYVLPVFGDMGLSAITTKELTDFRLMLLRKGLAVKTCRNIIDGNFRAMYRDARAELDELKGKDPWIDLHWPVTPREKPDPFEPEERDKILEFFREREPFYYAWVLMAFSIGTRPSEASALMLSDIDVKAESISINKSRHLGTDNQPKTQRSRRVIRVSRSLIEALMTLPSFAIASERVFLNKYGEALDAGEWVKDYWGRTLRSLGIRYRRFYCTRHTFITEAVKRGKLLKAIADYCGTSVAMIEANYCGMLTLNDLTVFQPSTSNHLKNLASPTGFEPVLSA